MSASSLQFANLIKKEALKLQFTLTLVLPPTDSINQLEPSLKSPSLQQCHEIIAQAYGFNTFNGVLTSNSPKSEFNSAHFKEALRYFILSENAKASSGLNSLIDLTKDSNLIDSLVSAVEQVQYLMLGFPRIINFKLPRIFHSLEYKFDWHFAALNPFLDEGTEAFFNLFLSLIIENLDTIEVYERNKSTVLVAPISLFYKHKITDFNRVKDLVIDLEDLINQSGILKVSSGLSDFVDHHHSKIEIELSTLLARNLQMIAKLNKNKKLAISKLDSVLDIYVRHYGTAFNSLFSFACLKQSPHKRMTGADPLKYQLNKHFYYKLLLEHLKLPDQELHACTTNFQGRTSISAIDQKLILDSVYLTDAITRFDDLYVRHILPIIDKYIQQQQELILVAKSLSKNYQR